MSRRAAVLLHPACATAPRDVADIERETGLVVVWLRGRLELVAPREALSIRCMRYLRPLDARP